MGWRPATRSPGWPTAGRSPRRWRCTPRGGGCATAPGCWCSLTPAARAGLAGMVLLARPMQAVLTLTIGVGAYFLAEGVAPIMYALEHRRELSGRWSWLLISGLVDIAISFMVITGLPSSAEWAIGVLVGINLLLGGASLIGLALAERTSNT